MFNTVSLAHQKLLYADNLNINTIKHWNIWRLYSMKIHNVQPMQLHNKIDWTPCVTSIDYKKAKDMNKVAKVDNGILNIIQKNPVKLTLREIISSRSLFNFSWNS